MAIKAVIADDHTAVRLGVSSLLDGTDIKIVGEASTGEEAISLTRRRKPNVLLLDVRIPEGDGLKTLAEVREQCPKTAVVMLSTFDNPTYIARSIALHAADYLLKGCVRKDLVSVIRSAVKGTGPLKAGEMLDISATMQDQSVIEPMTPRESQVVRNIALGLSNRDIASALDISIETVKEHVQKILFKLDCTYRTSVAMWALRKGAVS